MAKKTYSATLSRYQRVTVEVRAADEAEAEELVYDRYFDGGIDECDWDTESVDSISIRMVETNGKDNGNGKE